MGLYLSDDIYGVPDIQPQLIFIHGAVGKHYLAFPRLLHPLDWKDKESAATSTGRCKVSNPLVMLMEKLELSDGVFSLIGVRAVSRQQESAKTAKHLALIHVSNMSDPSKALFVFICSFFIHDNQDLCGEEVVNIYLQSACLLHCLAECMHHTNHSFKPLCF